jgi:superfamily II DNA or RNA helicase
MNKYTKVRLSRECQRQAFRSISEMMLCYCACIVKMFCGTGKTRIMVEIIITQEKTLNVIIFPNLALIRQFLGDYLVGEKCPKELKNYIQLNISSEQITGVDSTTDPICIQKFIKQTDRKIICVTYQSLDVLLDNLCEHVIDICLDDEAHRTTSIENKKLIYDEPYLSRYTKRIFFTATPVNKNNVIMYDREKNTEGKYGDCGPLAYEYTYLQGVYDKILKPFDIRIDMFTECSVISIYETIARAILTTGNTRVLTFHSEVSNSSDSDTSVLRFVDDGSFQRAFDKVLNEEFPEKMGKYKKITFRGLTGESKNKGEVLGEFDITPDDEIFILSSCATIGEGVDTKMANMCVFVDPKTSYTAIIQNIGRIVRINAGSDTKATVLIPVYVDRTKYDHCGDDKEKRDLVIREELVNGNYNGIANICAALKEEDPELYDIMVRYPSNFTPAERENALKEQRCNVDYSEDKRKYEYDIEEMIEEGEPVEIHTSSVDEPIVRHNIDDDTNNIKVQRLFQVEEENDDGELETVYYPIVSMNGKRIANLDSPKKQGRPRLDLHTNDEIKMLWSIKNGEDFGNNICSQVIECQVERVDSVERWKGMLLEATEYMDTEKKRPNSRTPLGGWVNKQTEYFDTDINKCKYIMKNPDVHKSWFDTRNKYSEYLCINRVANWKDMLSKVIEYMDNNNKPPSQINTSKGVKKLGKWISHNKTNYSDDITKSRNMMKNSEVRQLWCETVKKYSKLLGDGVTIWKFMHDKVVDYMKIHKKIPNKRDKNKDIQRMGSWIGTQKSNYDDDITKCDGAMSDTEVHKLWTETRRQYSEYLCLDNIADWKKTNIQLIEYMDVNKKRPSSDDPNKDVKAIGVWISNNNKSYDEDVLKSKERMKIQEVHELWSKTLTDYSEYLCDNITNWKIIHNKVIEYMKVNKKSPSYSDKNEDIKRMGGWLSGQKNNYDDDITKTKLILRNEELHALWKQTLVDYEEYLSNIPNWKKMHNTVVEFMKTNKQKPRHSIKDKDEGTMASWISTHHGNYNVDIHKSSGMMKNPELHKIWTDTLTAYSEYLCIDNIVKWKQNLSETIEYMKMNNKMPSSVDKNEDVRYIAKWISHNKKNYEENIANSKSIMKTPEIHGLWKKTVDEYSELLGDGVTIWKIVHTKLIEYMKTNKKRPAGKDKNNDIKKLGVWICTQNGNYNIDINQSACIMTVPEVHKLWSDTLAEYSEYLCIDNVANWKNKFNQLIDYRKIHNKNPTVSSDKILTNWISSNRQKYNVDILKCKECMKNQEIYDLWTEFIKNEKLSKDENQKAPRTKSMKLAKPSQNHPTESTEQKRVRVKSELSTLHQNYKTMTSANLGQRFNADPHLWHKYHEISEQNEASFPKDDIPRNRIIAELDKIKTKRTKHVVDMGCGKAEISRHFNGDNRFKFTNYDHISFDENAIKSCDISSVPNEDNTADIVILSLAMWGSNCHNYITEAYRILESGGTLYIIEPTKRWSDTEGFNIIEGTEANKLRKLLLDNKFFIIQENIQKFCVFICIKQ